MYDIDPAVAEDHNLIVAFHKVYDKSVMLNHSGCRARPGAAENAASRVGGSGKKAFLLLTSFPSLPPDGP